jgi:F-type H+-transporting ATPase subunit b
MAAIHLMPFAGGSIVDLDATYFVQLGVFLVTFILLYLVLFRPMIRLIEGRRKATVGTNEEAQSFREEAEQLETDVGKRLDEVRSHASAERVKMVGEVRQQERDRLNAAREAARQEVERAREEMERSGEAVRSELQHEVGAMASAVATQVLGRTL